MPAVRTTVLEAGSGSDHTQNGRVGQCRGREAQDEINTKPVRSRRGQDHQGRPLGGGQVMRLNGVLLVSRGGSREQEHSTPEPVDCV